MSQIRANKIQVPTNPDAFSNLVTDLATMADTANVLIPVASQAERDALTKKAGLAVTRTDLAGDPIELCDGTNWNRTPSLIIQANTQTVGSGMAVNAFTSGTFRPILQGGTFVGTTTANGDLTITYPIPFPNGVVGGVGFSGDGIYIVSGTPSTVAAPTTSSLFLRFAQPGGAVVASTTVRGTWFALGW